MVLVVGMALHFLLQRAWEACVVVHTNLFVASCVDNASDMRTIFLFFNETIDCVGFILQICVILLSGLFVLSISAAFC